MKILATQEDLMTGDLLVKVEGRARPVRLGFYDARVRIGGRLEDAVADAIASAKARQIFADDRHDRGWPKVAA